MQPVNKGKIPLLVIFAPTATGKTEIVGRLFSDNAPSFFAGKAEIISADSMQVYKKLDVGTAKPDSEFLSHLPHHLIDVCEPTDQFGTGEFIAMADQKCSEIYSRGKLPVICGGTSFYIKNFIFGLPVTPEADEKVRQEISDRMIKEGAEKLYAELQSIDPSSAEKIHINDKYRIGRALEVYYSSGKPLSSYSLPSIPREKYDFLTIYLWREKEELYERINQRVLNMFDCGLVDEVESLLLNDDSSEKLSQSCPGMSAIGYREFFTSGENPYEMFRMRRMNPQFAQTPRFLVWLAEIKRQIQRNSRHYAKKQITFFQPVLDLEENPANIHKIPAQDISSIEEKINALLHIYSI
ncbi:MAG: tRNA (adenosine(37)-N6)-dimethylallyltransferase MiaA [Treponemataceae bacterium]|nr:tRNA (adenosine(37)-N6)-dimethylallyltransferase MiaA [Treponemataceae bacterium]